MRPEATPAPSLSATSEVQSLFEAALALEEALESGSPPDVEALVEQAKLTPVERLGKLLFMGQDYGLGAFLYTREDWRPLARENLGKVKVPTLRNVDKRPFPWFIKAYGHNGYFKSLESIVHFYNTRDVLPVCLPELPGKPGVDCWPPPEVGLNLNTTEMGDLGLSPQEEAAIVAFLATLSDGYLSR